MNFLEERKMKKILSMLIAMVFAVGIFSALPFTVSGSTLKSGDYEYKVLDDGTASITDYTGIGGDIEIPSKLGGYKVTSIDL
jgi:hypothetical protein